MKPGRNISLLHTFLNSLQMSFATKKSLQDRKKIAYDPAKLDVEKAIRGVF